ncbi:hypothetical protein OG884_02230 [Streptosporangium sp. NBC_01755]|uniref:hypothetical protein n=1 Tax=Streptosporangium sp. NBC_01755 TaxID=2975949 RepID=UPI002DD89E95|nr:hypothetical protein [Streptosporangium sp. NBC_01755]WSD00778.1 hypothetical protein OG884_02230 [Streptosporangium sp. NBC_01755]
MTDDRKRLTASEERLVALADERAFKVLRSPTVKYLELEHAGQGQVGYVGRETPQGTISVLVSPETDLGRLTSIPGLTIPDKFRFGAAMIKFPKGMNKGKEESHDGYRIVCADITAYCRLLERLVSEECGPV